MIWDKAQDLGRLIGQSAEYQALRRAETSLREDKETVAKLDGQVWGQAFEAPLFCDEVEVVQQRLVADKHLKLRIKHQGRMRDAIWFGHAEPVAERVRLAYRLSLDEWNGQQRVQMVVEAAES